MQEMRQKLDALTEGKMQVSQQVPANANYFTDEDELAEELTGENRQVSQQVPASTEYYTDEDELAKETEWIVHRRKNAKKRKVEASCSTSKQPTSAERQQRPDQAAVKTPKPPPIIIYQVRDYDVIYKYLNTKLEQKYRITLLNSGDLKLNVDTEEHYRTASMMLNEAQFIWSTYENKQTRPIRVIVKKLHSSCSPEQIVQELRRKGYQILDAVNILKWNTKEPLPVFMLTFERTENIQKIYEITAIRGMKVEVTPYRKTKLLPQCKNCQSWGHTKAYCHKDPRCVKCAGQHNTDNCTKTRETPPKCYNSEENHPANYRGCIVAKELQALRNKASNKMKLPPQRGNTVAVTRNQQMPTQSAAGEAPSYSDAVKAHPSPSQGQPTADTSKKDAVSVRQNTGTTINQQLQLILAKLDKQERTHAALITRLDKLEKATFLKRN
jgi:hypothetical protein